MSRLLKVFFGLLLSMVAGHALADYQAVPTSFRYNGSNFYSTAQRACECSVGEPICSDKTIAVSVDNSNPPQCVWTRASGTTIVSAEYIFSCPYGGTLGNKVVNGKNVRYCLGANPPDPCPPVGSDAGMSEVTTAWATLNKTGAALAKVVVPDGRLGDATFCSGSCFVKPDMSRFPTVGSCRVDQKASANGYFRVSCSVPMTAQGSGCQAGTVDADPLKSGTTNYPPLGTTPSEPTVVNNSLGRCPEGSVPTGTDSFGLTICTGNAQPSPTTSTSQTTKPPVTSTDSSGNTVKTEVSTSPNADGSTTTTTKTTTTAPDGQVTVVVKQETGSATGGSQGVKDVPQEQKDLCAKNPNLNICKNSQVLGSCDDITCTGDAIQCATLRAAASMQCKNKRETDELKASSLYSLGSGVANGSDPLASSLPSKANGSVVTMPSSLDQSGWLGAGSPFRDVTFTVQGKTITVPLEKATGYLVGLRYALMVVALLVSFRLLSGVILRD